MDELLRHCRTCGTTINKEFDVNLFEESNFQLVALIQDIADMWMEYDNILPDFICLRCKTILDQILQFRSICQRTHRKLLAAIKDLNKRSELNHDYESNPNVGGEDSQHNESSEEYEIIQESDIEEEVPETTKSDVIYVENTIKSKAKRRDNRHLKSWICDQCGGVFKSSTYLKLHLLRHTDEKKFECDICKRRYYTQNEMLRHKILHTNARPYACRYCDKTFRGTSSKAVHERTHTNERPFDCRYCDKSFRSTSVRKMHEGVHLNNRKFHCEQCDQWFLRSSHLALHQRTKIHKAKCPS
ncbi:transcription factor Ouib [Drosophila sulfurigaster albostrigata]|uniref:transcription factor Ouib n=1 Tax=Drosophila sulfurigaster albostrigata TaxID=89887 RepID=UPI002D21AF6F|nr:transcription factor Ouib [Drosophila sulfurigaster albostrigata]